MVKTSIHVIASLLPMCAFAQRPTLVPGALDFRRVPAGIFAGMTFAVRGTDTAQTGTFAYEVSIHGDTLTLVSGVHDRILGHEVDTLISHIPDLMPIRLSASASSGPGTGTGHFSFSGTTTTGSLSDSAGKVTVVDNPRPPGAWTIRSLPLVLQAADLRPGDTFGVPLFHPAYSEPATLMVAVAGPEQVRGRDCWKVSVFLDRDTQFATFWLDQHSHVICRQVSHVASGVSMILETSAEPLVHRTRTTDDSVLVHQWNTIVLSPDTRIDLDTAHVASVPDGRRAWIRWSPSQRPAKPSDLQILEWEIDCQRGTSRVVATEVLNRATHLPMATSDPGGPRLPIVARSPWYDAAKIICGL